GKGPAGRGDQPPVGRLPGGANLANGDGASCSPSIVAERLQPLPRRVPELPAFAAEPGGCSSRGPRLPARAGPGQPAPWPTRVRDPRGTRSQRPYACRI